MSMTDPATGRASGNRARATASRLARDTPLPQVTVMLALFLYGALTLDGFSSVQSVKTMLLIAAFLGLAAMGQTILVLVGYLDLSVPGFIGVGNVLTIVLVGHDHWAFGPALVAVLGCSILLGSISGLICYYFRVASIVVTIGMNFALLGVDNVLYNHAIGVSSPAWLTRIASVTGKTFGIGVPPLVVFWLIVAVIVGLVLRRTIIGRRIYLTGANPVAAELALVKSGRVVIGAFALSALSAAATGVLLLGFSGAGSPTIGTPYLFTSLTAIIVGGTAVAGARGDYWRTVVGAIMLTVINTVLLAKGYSAADQQILFGLIILVVAFAYSRDARLRDQV